MTCIVGLEQDGVVYLGGDSAGVSGLDIHTRIDEKVFKNEEFVLGFTSSFRMGQLLRYAFVPPDHNPRKDDFAYLVTDFVDAVRVVFKEKGYMSRLEDEEERVAETGGTFLVGYNGHLYVIADDFQVGRTHDGYTAIGCGEAYALGSLYSTRDMKDPIERLNLALNAAQKFSAGVREPFNFVSTDQNDYINISDRKIAKVAKKSRRK